jgi:hypothetical protein
MSPEELANVASSAEGRADIVAECGLTYEEGTFTDKEIQEFFEGGASCEDI